MSECKCDFRTKTVGDGCEVCNPSKALEYAKETIAELEQRIKELELVEKQDAETIAILRDVMALKDKRLQGLEIEQGEPVAWLLDHVPNAGQRQLCHTKAHADNQMEVMRTKEDVLKRTHPYDVCLPLFTASPAINAAVAAFAKKAEEACDGLTGWECAESIRSLPHDESSLIEFGAKCIIKWHFGDREVFPPDIEHITKFVRRVIKGK